MSFEEAAKYIANATGLALTQEQQLQLYAHFKQATEGNCTRPKPAFYLYADRLKWTAWSQLQGCSQQEAQQHYIQLVSQLAPGWRSSISEEGQGRQAQDTGLFMSDEEYETYKQDKKQQQMQQVQAGTLSGVLSRLQDDRVGSEDVGDKVFEWCRAGQLDQLKQHVLTLEQARLTDDAVRPCSLIP
jgi:acyl-CoA-binding protein